MKNINEFYSNTEKAMLVDGDLLSYKITSGLEEAINWGDDNWTLWSDFNLAKQLNSHVPVHVITVTDYANEKQCLLFDNGEEIYIYRFKR